MAHASSCIRCAGIELVVQRGPTVVHAAWYVLMVGVILIEIVVWLRGRLGVLRINYMSLLDLKG